MANNNSAVGVCCFESPTPAVNPLEAENIVIAGGVMESSCTAAAENSCALATAYFPFQEYRAGFCPTEALKKGTLFPELVSDYVGGCC